MGERIDWRDDKLAYSVIGAAIEVHRVLGPGYLESVYEEAMAIELTDRGISFDRQKIFALDYKGQRIGEGRVDLLVANELIVELKAVDVMPPVYRAQVISYLRAFNLRRGLLINFNVPVLKDGAERIVN